jgi:hypothetical protein
MFFGLWLTVGGMIQCSVTAFKPLWHACLPVHLLQAWQAGVFAWYLS